MITYSVADAARILKVSPSRIRYWRRTALLPEPEARADEAAAREADEGAASPEDAPSARSSEELAWRDLVTVKAVLTLLEHGVPLRRIRQSVRILQEHVPELEEPLGALRVWSEGSARVVVRHDGVLLEPDGQMVLEFGGEEPGDSQVTSLARERVEQAVTGRRDEGSVSAYDWFEIGCGLDASPDTYEQALEAYRKAVDLDPDFADAHCNLGAVLYNKGARAAARRAFERCLALEPEHVEAHFNLANLLEEDGLDELALEHYGAALARDPLYPDLHVNLALLYEKRQDAKAAREHWRRYLQIDPGGAWASVARERVER